MNTNELKDYLEIVLDLEAKKLMTERIIENIGRKRIDLQFIPLEKKIQK